MVHPLLLVPTVRLLNRPCTVVITPTSGELLRREANWVNNVVVTAGIGMLRLIVVPIA